MQLQKEVNNMSEKEKKALETITKAIPQMNDFQKGYLIGMGEALSEQNKKGDKKNERINDSTGNRITNF